MLHHIKRTTKILIIFLLILIAVILTAIRLLLPEIQQYQQAIERELSKALNTTVRIGEIGTNMRGFQPELVLSNIAIAETDAGKAAIKLKEIRMSINFLTALGHWDVFSAGRVTLVGAELVITRKPDGSIAIAGLKSGDEHPVWLLRGGDFEVVQSQITWHDEMFHSPPRIYSNIDVAISNDYLSANHTIHVRVNPTTEQAQSLRMSLQLTGDIFSSKGITGEVYVEGSALDVNEILNDRLPKPWALLSGQADIKLWGHWQLSKLVDLAGNIDVTDVRLSQGTEQKIDIPRLSTALNWQRLDQKWRLDLRQFSFDDGQSKWPETNFSLVFDDAVQDETKMGLAISHLELGALTKLASFISVENHPSLSFIKQLQAQGSINNLDLFVNTGAETWAVDGAIEQLRFNDVDELPGVNQLSAHIRGSNEKGQLNLASKDLEFSQPNMFRKPLLISQLKGHVDWHYAEGHWHIQSQDFRLDTPVLKSQNRWHIKIPGSLEMEAAFIDMQSHIMEADLPQLKTYWPVGAFDDELMAWLDRAYVAGHMPAADILFYGQLNNYPFDQGDGVLYGQLDLKGVELDFHEDWPHFKDFDAKVYFHNDSATLTAQEWYLNGATIVDTFAEIASFADSDLLNVRTKIKGKIEHCLGFLQRSPLKTVLAPVNKLIKVTGENTIEVDMQLPLIASAKAKVDGVAKLDNAKMIVKEAGITVDNLVGQLSFNERGVFTTKALSAKALTYPIKLTIEQLPEATKINVDGRTDMIQLQSLFSSNNSWKLARGQFQYDLGLNIANDPAITSHVYLSSNLKEVSLLLPGTLEKASGEVSALSITTALNGTEKLPIRLNYANKLQAALVFDRHQHKLLSGGILLGQGRADYQKLGVVKLQIDQPKFKIDSWLDISESSDNSKGSLLDSFTDVDVNIDHLIWQETDFNSVDLQLTKVDELWRGHVDSGFGAGRISLPSSFDATSVLDLDLDFLDLSSLSQLNNDKQQEQTVASTQPQLILNSKKLLWHNKNLGRLHVQTVADKNGARIKAFKLKAKTHQLTLQGNWVNRKDELRTLIKGKLEVENLGRLLSRLNISKEMQGSKALFDFSLRWPGAPYAFNLATAQGIVDTDLEQGSLLGIEPGVGRILGAFNLSEWKRRISLDFSDVVAKGLAYNKINGLFYLSNGNAETDNLAIEGVSARIEFSGRTGLVAKDYDQIVTVTPKTTAVIPFAGTIAGFVVQTVTGSHPDSLTRTQYKIKGSWEQPEVTALHDNDGALRKAWSGITGLAPFGNTDNNIEVEHE